MYCKKEIPSISAGRIVGFIATTQPSKEINLQKTVAPDARHSIAECEARL